VSLLVNKSLESRIEQLNKSFHVAADVIEGEETNKKILAVSNNASHWLDEHSLFFRNHSKLDFQNRTGPIDLREDFNSYMKSVGLEELERQTADIQVMNPHSGDWVKGVQIVMAEMGLKDYNGPQVRGVREFSAITKELASQGKSNIHHFLFTRDF
jgi:hypothetical protein